MVVTGEYLVGVEGSMPPQQPMEVPLVDLKAQFAPLEEEIISAIRQTLLGMNLFLGPQQSLFEEAFAACCDAKFCIGVGTGTDALVMAMRAIGVGEGDEVITVAHSFIATVEAILLVGGRPIFVDVDPTTYTIDPRRIEERITPRTRAIVPVHLYGQMADMEPVLAIAKKHDLRVVEDACQAHGATYKGLRAGSIGDAAAFSFYFSKNLGAYGEGGAITTCDPEVDRAVRLLRNHGSTTRYYHESIGTNARMDEIQAAILNIKLRYLDDWNTLRRQHANTYRQLLADTPLTLPRVGPKRDHVYHLYVVRAPERERLRAWLQDRQVSTGIHYPVPIHLQEACSGLDRPSLPTTEALADEVLSLPMYAELTEDQIAYVADCVRSFYAAN